MNDEEQPEKDLKFEFMRIAKQVREDFVGSIVDHPGEVGIARENMLNQFLKRFIPEPFDIDRGFVIDSKGQRSEQIDSIIYDKTLSRGIGLKGDVIYYPCEAVVAVGEVRTLIPTRKKLREALGRIGSVHSLSRHEIEKEYSRLPIERGIMGFIFTSKALSRNTMYKELLDYCSSRPRSHWPNIIVEFERYIISYYEKTPVEGSTLFPDNAESWYTTSDSQQGIIILLFACYLIQQLVALRDRYAPDLLEYFGLSEIQVDLLGPVPKCQPLY